MHISNGLNTIFGQSSPSPNSPVRDIIGFVNDACYARNMETHNKLKNIFPLELKNNIIHILYIGKNVFKYKGIKLTKRTRECLGFEFYDA
jgi:hypothetical protein